MRTALVIGALLFAASASAQDQAPKVWTDADLAKPLPKVQRQADPAVLAAMKARADYIPNMGSRGAAAAIRASFDALPAPAAPSTESLYARELALQRATAPREPILYASQPLYPFVSVIYSNGPYRPAYHRRPAPCPVPPVFLRR
jgi:hypothetical protein